MKITAKHYQQEQAEQELNQLLNAKEWNRLAQLTDPTIKDNIYKDLIFTITLREDELSELPDFIKDRFLIKYWSEDSDQDLDDDRDKEENDEWEDDEDNDDKDEEEEIIE
jgi:hypothetical protein